MTSKPVHEMDEFQRFTEIRFNQLSFYVFQKNYIDLKSLFDFFCTSKEGFELTNIANRHKLDAFQSELIRAIHNFVASVGSLVDHTRKFHQRHYEGDGEFPDYQKRVEEIFVKDELVSFVQDYRNYCLHYASPNLSTGIEFVRDKGTWQFIRLEPSELISGSFSWKSASKNFIKQFATPFDLPPVLGTYFSKVVAFYQWYYERLSEIHKVDNEKVSEAQRTARKQIAPQIMMIFKMELEDTSLPVGIDELLKGLLPPQKLAELEPLLGTNEWIKGALTFMVESELVTPELSKEILEKLKRQRSEK